MHRLSLLFTWLAAVPIWADPADKADKAHGFFASMQTGFETYVVGPMATFLFFDVAFFTDKVSLPFIVLWLLVGAIFLTFKMQFINVRSFKHAIMVTSGKYDNPDDPGEISHFQALSSALSATVGLGNIAGVAVAVSMGGPGAIFWMIIAGFFGMTSKFSECTLALMYRSKDSNGNMLGGPMSYLSKGFEEEGKPKLGKALAALFAIMAIGGSFGGGNMFQANQTVAAITATFPSLAEFDWAVGLVLAALVGVVIIGGIKRIGRAASVIMPFMSLVYLLAGTWILVANASLVPGAISFIISQAFTPAAGYGGFVGVLFMGFRRAAFSNEAGIGSAAIAHSAAATKEPVREGIVASLGPFIDTIVICTMTGLIVVVTGVYTGASGDGIAMTSAAYAQTLPWFPSILTLSVFFFAFSTMISWSYYGERCWAYLFGADKAISYRILFLFFVFCGSVFSLKAVLDFSDLMVLGMAFPNLIGVVFMSGKIKAKLDDYWSRYKAGKMQVFASSANNLQAQPACEEPAQ